MKKLFLIRHAKSSWEDNNLTDFERPLNHRGKHDVPLMAKRLEEHTQEIDLLITSSAKRAKATAKGIMKHSNIEFAHYQETEQLYHASPSTLISIIGQQKSEIVSLAVVGHNPGLTDLANQMGNISIDNLPTLGIICFEFEITNWAAVSTVQGDFIFFDYPKLHTE